MAVTRDNLLAEVNTTPQDNTVLDKSLAASKALLDKYVAEFADDPVDGVPGEVFDEAWLAVAVDMFNRHQAPNGVLNQQYDLADGGVAAAAVRISSDPLRAARPLLA